MKWHKFKTSFLALTCSGVRFLCHASNRVHWAPISNLQPALPWAYQTQGRTSSWWWTLTVYLMHLYYLIMVQKVQPETEHLILSKFIISKLSIAYPEHVRSYRFLLGNSYWLLIFISLSFISLLIFFSKHLSIYVTHSQ